MRYRSCYVVLHPETGCSEASMSGHDFNECYCTHKACRYILSKIYVGNIMVTADRHYPLSVGERMSESATSTRGMVQGVRSCCNG
jgi:hypothetical protein